MGANISTGKRRTEFMKLSLPELAGWHLIVTCAGCRDPRYVPIDTLLDRLGSQHTLGQIVPRLRRQFRTCSQAPAAVRLFSSLDERDPKALEVVLIGPGHFELQDHGGLDKAEVATPARPSTMMDAIISR